MQSLLVKSLNFVILKLTSQSANFVILTKTILVMVLNWMENEHIETLLQRA